jgi:hypothetical protein
MSKLKVLITSVVLLAAVSDAFGFVMIGPPDANSTTGNGVNFNITDDLGGPKELKTFYRWNIPYLTYSFDASFVRYFGYEGMEAVNDAFRVVNDFFIPADKSYVGVSRMDLSRDGFRSNYNTAWVNTTAQNQQIIDLKSLTLGILINELGVGNPHRYAFTIGGISVNQTGTQWNFNVRLRNYDPITWEPTDKINGVTYSYRLIHDGVPPVAPATLPAPTFADMEEFTTDTSGNAWTAVSSIIDGFYGNTAIYWTDSPTLFNFGVYYDGKNAMGGQYKPRHALTYDDAGALKYLYRTNNFVVEDLDLAINLIIPANQLPDPVAQYFPNPQNNWTVDPIARLPHAFPRRQASATAPNAGVPIFLPTSPFSGIPIIGPVGGANPTMGMGGQQLRGGIDRMQFYHVPFDSLVGNLFTPTNYIWKDTWVEAVGQTISGGNNTTPGASQFVGFSQLRYFTQTLGRNVGTPDILFVVDALGQSVDGVPIAWRRTDNAAWTDYSGIQPIGMAGVGPAGPGPGVINPPAGGPGVVRIRWEFGRMSEGFELIWSGQSSVVGNQDTYSLWGYIKGPAASDLVIFPSDSLVWRLENEVTPKVDVPLITMLSDNGGITPIATNSYTRTQETISIIGNGLSGGTAIEITDGDLVLQTLFPVQKYLISDQRIDIPPGVLNLETEGTSRRIRVWNTIGPSETSTQFFNIYTGHAMVLGTTRDGAVFDRAQSLTVYGSGFKSRQGRAADGKATLTHLRVEDGQGNVVLPTDGNSTAVNWEVLSDTQAVLPLHSITSVADGTYRRIRVARGNDSLSTLSPTNNVNLINYITSTPNITALNTIDSNGTSTPIGNLPTEQALRRDLALELTGTAMNTASAVEIVNQDGSSFPNPVVINLPNAGVIVDDNGIRIQISADVIPYSDADGHTVEQRRKFKVYNAVGTHTAKNTFNVNVQPVYSGTGGFVIPNTFNRHQTLGDDVTIVGSGLLAVKAIHIVDENGTALSAPPPNITLPNPGVTVTDTSIKIDTSTIQFSNGANADSYVPNRYRRFLLASARADVMSSQSTRFDVGIPPTYTSVSGFTEPNYRRDLDTLDFKGTELGIIIQVEIVDVNGNPFANVSPITPTTGVNVLSSNQLTVDANASALTGQGYLFDSSTILSDGNGMRRIRVTTPFGVTTSTMADGFTVSADPVYMPLTPPYDSLATFAGTTDADVTNLVMDYNASDTATNANAELFINGSNFRGVKTITFEDNSSNAYITVNVDPNSPPTGIMFNGAGTRITITGAFILSNGNPNWAESFTVANRRVRLTSAGGRSEVTPTISTTGAPSTFSLGGLGYTAPHFQRDGDLVMTAATGVDLSGVTEATLVDNLGNQITGVNRITFLTGLTVDPVADTATISANAFSFDGNETDTNATPGRRVKLYRPTLGPTWDLVSHESFTVSSPPDVQWAGAAAVYLEATPPGTPDGGAKTGTYSNTAGAGATIGDLSITAALNVNGGGDLKGVSSIDFYEMTTPDIVTTPVPTTTLTLPGVDWIVNAAGTTLTIPASVITAKGLSWYDGSADRAFRLHTPATTTPNMITPTITATP